MGKVILTILLFAHLIGCNSAIVGYVIGSVNTSDQVVRQLQ